MKTKHITATHENLRIYCHYFNNDKICPFSDQCIFLHEESTKCKYGNFCERDKCMYKHENIEDVDDTDDVEDVNDKNDDDKESNKTFINPSELENSTPSKPDEPYLRPCTVDKCDNICRGAQGLTDHLRSAHGIPSWY